ncbi:MAG: hypothetical protein ACRD1Q_12165, partial [Vicinamibacterales bacterium]
FTFRSHYDLVKRGEQKRMRQPVRTLGTWLPLLLLLSGSLSSQQPAQPQAPQTPRAAAPIDLTGYWVSVVTEDWRWRMLTPPKGDYASVPLTVEGRKVADTWDPAKAASDGCKAYGAPAVMRMPGRLNITWENDTTLKIETDAGRQTRRLRFESGRKPDEAASWQGHSVASWEVTGGRGGRGDAPAPRGGTLKVITTNLRAGYLRKNGVPYSENAVVTEYFDPHAAYGTEWFTVTTIVDDPRYLAQTFVTSTHFKREPDGAKWSPAPCE